jgi:LysR family transcriptional regulator for metE and metH
MAASMLEIRHLRLMRAIAEEGGPTRAAARLHLTQSAVSHQLAELEGRLGVALFARVRRQLTLTPAGARLLEASRRMLADLDKVERELHTPAGAALQPLKLCVETFTSYHWLPAVVSYLRCDHPLVDLRVAVELRREPVAALLSGALDLAIVSTPVRDRDLVVVPLGSDEWTVILAPKHVLAARKFVAADEIGKYLLYSHDAPRSDVERLRDIARVGRTRLPAVKIVPLTDLLVDSVRCGLGIGLVSKWAVAPQLERGEIVARRFTREGLPEKWSAVYRRDAASRLPLARVAELIREQMKMPAARAKARRV